MSTALVVALDFPTADDALKLARSLRGIVPWVKVGLELYLDAGQKLVADLKAMGFQVFVDLKFMDIPNTVQAAVRQVTRMGADMMTLHTVGGRTMAEAALTGRDQALAAGQTAPLILGVTVLTSMSPRDLVWNPHGTADELRDFIVHLAVSAQAWNLDGVVCSGKEIRAIRTHCDPKFQLLTPGIRLPDAEAGDQQRVCTPAQASRDGSNFLVVGRPITRAANPAQAAQLYTEATISTSEA